MHSNNNGFVFACRRDCLGNIGVMEGYSTVIRGDEQIVFFTCCVDFDGKPVKPAHIDISSGFLPLDTLVESEETFDADLQRFVKSNKPYFGVMSNFAMIANVTLKYNINTGDLIENKSVIDFFVPVKSVASIYDVDPEYRKADCPAVVCERAVIGVKDENGKLIAKGVHTFGVEESVLKAYKVMLCKSFTLESTSSRLNYLKSRLK